MWKENILEDLEVGELEFESVGEFLAEIKKEFRIGEKKSVKVAELRKLEQGGRMMEEFVQKFKRTAKMSRSLTVDFILFSLFIFILLFFSFSFSIFRTTQAKAYQSCDYAINL